MRVQTKDADLMIGVAVSRERRRGDTLEEARGV
jgi:hypothetical protein